MNQRYLPEQPLPPYTYVPGRSPHPVTDPRGHQFGAAPVRTGPLTSAQWRDCHAYLRGIDLFNAGFYWEAHEVWEAAWQAAGRHGREADFLKGLIKLAAAGVKAYEARPDGIRRHLRRAIELLTAVAAGAASGRLAGLDLHRLVAQATAVAVNPEDRVALASTPPCAGLLLVLLPQ